VYATPLKLIHFCSYDYGALLAIDLKMKHPARALGIVLESKVCRFDMTGFAHMTTCFSFLDEKYVKSGKGLKGKIAFLWTLQHKGRPDPGMRQRHSKYGTKVAALLKTKLVDVFQQGDVAVAQAICCMAGL
jgi:hypothetical protein